MEEGDFKDIIRHLKDGGMLMTVALKILGLLDYQSLKSAEQVSLDWYQAVVSGNLYRTLYQQNVESNGIWKDADIIRQKTEPPVQAEQEDDHLLYKTYCGKLHQTVENLNENWKTGGCKKELKRGQLEGPFQHHSCNSESVKMSTKWIVNQKRGQTQIDVYDRWTHKHHSTISCNEFELGAKIQLLLNNDLLVFFTKSLGDGGLEFHIWDVESNQKLHELDDLESFPSVSLDDYKRSKIYKRAVISRDGRYLMSIIYLGKSDTRGDLLVTLRKLSGNQAEILNQKLNQDTQPEMFFGLSFFIDELYIILALPNDIIFPDVYSQPVIEIYTNTPETFLEKFFPIPSAKLLDYSNGYLVVYVDNSIRIWDACTRDCVSTVCSEVPPVNDVSQLIARIIDNKYLFVIHRLEDQLEGSIVQVFDMKTITSRSTPLSARVEQLPKLFSSSVRKIWNFCHCLNIVADQYQVYLIGFSDKRSFVLTLDFMHDSKLNLKSNGLPW